MTWTEGEQLNTGDRSIRKITIGLSSKGSRSPPSVFERLGLLSASSSEKKRRTSYLHSSKRRRSSNNEDGITKKAWLETREYNMTSSKDSARKGKDPKGGTPEIKLTLLLWQLKAQPILSK
ncbi:hypothetical protein Bca52824_056976 [Brassica carinata]|uniref:Uncharacterized protein n=1 Tax=Brassica carinata TaxID=52824 RepID=A0A8X7QQJ2_BRACI|nr:hypothetical protein Bca52824_056976 [Brassica carinata]